MTQQPAAGPEQPSDSGHLEPARSWPTTTSGWIAVIAAGVALAFWVVVPAVSSGVTHQSQESGNRLVPTIGLVLTALTALFNLLVLWPGKQRTLANGIATSLTVLATLIFSVFVFGSGFGAN